ncbi:hypothetical protein FEM48_Zijuj07G0135700 [Ziziphus jujuba var. spinosa]|uniref:Protein FAR1-RELATED SEQUENCE n=1 Tax=Ziziphus jujuba var. spinosa TaxID=714518 RepID=A0A978V4X9_ZIZJJ|nr:hypothetical protein FEM48_Zijuj07G0135700 [Ziziphus jujuba var. spinosa]
MVVKAYPVGMVPAMNHVNGEDEGESSLEPYVGLEFDSAEDAREFYTLYAKRTGFKIRTGQLYRSRTDGTVSSRRFVCSKEGFQLNSRTGCPALIRVQRRDSGKWVIDLFLKDHNHDLGPMGENHPPTLQRKISLATTKPVLDVSHRPRIKSVEEIGDGRPCPSGVINAKRLKREGDDMQSKVAPFAGLEFNSANDGYQFYQAYAANAGFRIRIGQLFRSKLDGSITSRRFVCSKEGFQHPSRLGCGAFMRIKRQDSGRWVVDRLQKDHNHELNYQLEVDKKSPTSSKRLLEEESGGLESEDIFNINSGNLVKRSRENHIGSDWAMSGRRPFSIIADQDKVIQQAIRQVFPGTHHRFSLWQMKAKEREYLNLMDGAFKYEYEKCIYESRTTDEFDTAWNGLLHRYGLIDNAWLTEMYQKRENWVPAYLRGTFFAGIPLSETTESFFGAFLNAQTPLVEFVSRYERGIERRREAERREDFNTFNLQAFLQTKEPVEEQCRRLYTLTVFKIFQKEVLQSYSYLGFKIYEEGPVSRYLVRKGGNDNEKCMVTIGVSNLSVACSCQMFEFEGLLCRHILRVFQILDIKEVPSRYILHRWTKNAEYGTIHDLESAGSPQELKSLMLWSLRDTASKYIEAGATSLDKHKLAYEIMREGGRKLGW